MIILTIALSIAGGVIAALAIIATVAIQANNRLEREKKAALEDLEAAIVGKEALKGQYTQLSKMLEETQRLYTDLLAEYRKLEARNTVLVEAMEARPTQPKRTVRKSATQATEN